MAENISEEIQLTLAALKANRFDAHYAGSAEAAKAMMLDMIPQASKVGIGDSASLRQIGIIESLDQRGNIVINPFNRLVTENYTNRRLFANLSRQVFNTDIVITGSNAATKDGKLVSIDYAGNRVAATIYGAPKIILMIGRNKIVENTHAAIHRIKNVISPFHAKTKGHKTPCTVTGKCSDCDSPERICGITIILERRIFL